ncbi:MAG TPA: methyltransferase domain-containing protein [Mycobacteriales bacterium]|nr:methyltransferase domain-containing protein [Mycobacteriales bacterium]
MTIDHYAGAARRWAEGATIVYRPIAHRLLDTSPHRLTGRAVLDAGAGTGVVSAALTELGARPIALDLSVDMLAWGADHRPPAVAGDVTRLPLRSDAVDDTVAAFVFNHLTEPHLALAEAGRVTRPGGGVLACVYANSSRSEVRDALDEAARGEGWRVPDWYVRLKQTATPLLGDPHRMAATADRAGLADVIATEEVLDVGVEEPEQLVDYRLGQAQFAAWLDELGPRRAEQARDRLVEVVRPIMRPYRPTVVFLVARAR